MSLTRIGEPWQRKRKLTPLVKARLAELKTISGDGSDLRHTPRHRESSPSTTRPQAKTAARKAFEAWLGCPYLSCLDSHVEKWAIWHSAWRTARGAKPTKREDA